MRKNIKYGTPDIEITRFDIEKKVMTDFETDDGDKIYGDGPSHPDETVPDLGEDW